MEMISLEDLGFCEPGRAWMSIYESCQDYKGYYEIDGRKLFVNMNGGLRGTEIRWVQRAEPKFMKFLSS